MIGGAAGDQLGVVGDWQGTGWRSTRERVQFLQKWLVHLNTQVMFRYVVFIFR